MIRDSYISLLILLSILARVGSISIVGYVLDSFSSAAVKSASITFSYSTAKVTVISDINGKYNFTTETNVSYWSAQTQATGYYNLTQSISGISSTVCCDKPSFFESLLFLIPVANSSVPTKSFYYVFSWPWITSTTDLDSFLELPDCYRVTDVNTGFPYTTTSYGNTQSGRNRDSKSMWYIGAAYSKSYGPEVVTIQNLTGDTPGRFGPYIFLNTFGPNFSTFRDSQRPRIQLYSVESKSLISTIVLPSNYSDVIWNPFWFDVDESGSVTLVDNSASLVSNLTTIQVNISTVRGPLSDPVQFTATGPHNISNPSISEKTSTFEYIYTGINLPIKISGSSFVTLTRNVSIPGAGYANTLDGDFHLVPSNEFQDNNTHAFVLTWDLTHANSNQKSYNVTISTSSCIFSSSTPNSNCSGIVFSSIRSEEYVTYIKLTNVTSNYVIFVGGNTTDWNSNIGSSLKGLNMPTRMEIYKNNQFIRSVSATSGKDYWIPAFFCSTDQQFYYGLGFSEGVFKANATCPGYQITGDNTVTGQSTTDSNDVVKNSSKSTPTAVLIAILAGGALLIIIIAIILVVIVVVRKRGKIPSRRKNNQENSGSSTIELNTTTATTLPTPLPSSTNLPEQNSNNRIPPTPARLPAVGEYHESHDETHYRGLGNYPDKTPVNSDIQLPPIRPAPARPTNGPPVKKATIGAVFTGFVLKSADIEMIKPIGQGAYGTVFLGEYKKTKVAVKQLNDETADAFSIEEFTKEAKLMKDVPPHPNVVMFRGVTIPPDTLCIVTDFCNEGSLLSYLQKNSKIGWKERVQFMKDIAAGMLHLHTCISGKEIIHRDLAARNILLQRGVALVGDFGMARTKDTSDESGKTVQATGPLKWMAPEAIFKREFSIKSDVFSFGVVMFEIITGEVPWKGVESVMVAHLIAQGKRMTVPTAVGCPPAIQKIMVQCWHPNPDRRPDFSQICDQLEAIDV